MSDGTIQGYRLSPQQTHLWLLQQHTPASVFWSRCVVRVKGAVNLERLERAIETVVEAHEILRTTFPLLPGMTVPVQVIHQDSTDCVTRDDLTALSQEKQNEFIVSRAAADVTSDFDSLPLFRCELLQLSSEELVMLLRAPSLCADLRSLEMLVSQIATCYGSEDLNPIAPMQYADFAEWHHELWEGKEGEPGTQYWKSHALHSEIKIPFESPLAEETHFQPESLRLDLPPESVSAGQRFSQLALACWQVFIQRLNASSPVTIGKAFDGRRHPELASSVGLYTRHVPLAVDFVDEQLTMDQLLERLAQAEKEAFQWQEYFAWPETKTRPAYFSVCFE